MATNAANKKARKTAIAHMSNGMQSKIVAGNS